MPGNHLGQALTLASWGESHGPAVGGVLDGMPPGIQVQASDIQLWLDRRRPGQSRFTTQRKEDDQLELLSGIYEGKTTGQPLAFLVRNRDARAKDYDELANLFRPSHADWSWHAKYGHRDPRGGGRSSARETVVRVAAGAIALLVLRHLFGDSVVVRAALAELGGDAANRDLWDWSAVAQDPVGAPEAQASARWQEALDTARRERSSLGAIIEVEALAVPPGLGEPVYDRLDADIAKALMSINAVKGVEIGSGFNSARMRGEDHADQMRAGPRFLSNHAGGILGGVSTGEPIRARCAFKPTASIPQALKTITRDGTETEVETHGRHDPCVAVRAPVIVEAMLAFTLADHALRHRGQTG